MKRQYIVLPTLAGMLFSATAFAEFPQPPLDCAIAGRHIQINRFQLDSKFPGTRAFTERVQAQWRGCTEGVDFMFSYMRRGEKDMAAPDDFSLLTVRRSTGWQREIWRFRFGGEWKLRACEFATYTGNEYDASMEATDEDLKEMETSIRMILQDMMMGFDNQKRGTPTTLARIGIGL
jgi:hypothetical protein